MSTLLVNQKMDAALIERIEASLSGRRKQGGAAHSTARLTSLVRLGAALGIIAVVAAAVVARHRERAELARARAALFETWTAQTTPMAPGDRGFLPRLEQVLAGFSGAYPGDLVAESLGTMGRFLAVLTRPSVYVRGPLGAFGSPAGVAKAASESGKDALLLCLLEPPASRAEKTLLTKARIALGGGASVQQATPSVRRLHDIEVSLPFLLPSWGERVQDAKDMQALLRLERELKKAPVLAAKSVLRAELLIAALDEPNDAGGVTELDGEHAHSIRLLILDLVADKPLLRIRRQLDPSWITPNRRSQYARELDGCKFALDVHDAVHAQEN